MPNKPVRFARLASQGGSISLGSTGSNSELHTIVIGTGAVNPNTSLGASLVLFGSNPSTSDSKISTIAASWTQSAVDVDFAGAICPNGIQLYMLNANADVTLTYS